MKNILRYCCLLLLTAFIVASIMFFLRYPERFDETDDIIPSLHTQDYFVKVNMAQTTEFISPQLPDTDIYSVEAIKQKMPDYELGEVQVEPLEKGYSFVRSQTAYYGDLQSRIDPLAIVVRSGVVSLDDVTDLVADETLISREEGSRFMLHVPLVIREKATLILEEGETLLMNANSGAMMPIYGRVYIVESHVIGWDMQQDQPAYYQSSDKFRPYIIAWCGSHMDIGKSYLGYLGYNAPKSYGLTYSSCENDKYVEESTDLTSGTGWLLGNEFEQLYFGFYSYETDRAAIVGNKYSDNIVYGIDPHDYSKNLIIADNEIYGTREKHGIIVSRGISDSFIFNNRSYSNAGSGIMIDRDSRKNMIANNESYNNAGDGIAIYESPHNILFQNSFSKNEGAGMRVRNSWQILSHRDVINDNKGYALELYTEDLSDRDLEKDPYEMKGAISMNNPEIVSNQQGLFKLLKFDQFILSQPKIFKVKGVVFGGDLQDSDLTSFNSVNEYEIKKR